MILWIIKQLLSLRKIFSGRAQPSELAWGLALGLAIGLVPKGNLVSMVLIGLLVTLRVNHGMAALAAVGFSYLASYFDPWTHQVGAAILLSPTARPTLDQYWDMPLVPWTELNNTVVMGSTVLALGGILPTAMVSLPVFRMLAPKKHQEDVPKKPAPQTPPAVAAAAVRIEKAAPLRIHPVDFETKVNEGIGEGEIDESVEPTEAILATHVETQIDIIRMMPIDTNVDAVPVKGSAEQGAMNEALGYLLRRLRDSRQEKAA